jgi:hypothetical protein
LWIYVSCVASSVCVIVLFPSSKLLRLQVWATMPSPRKNFLGGGLSMHPSYSGTCNVVQAGLGLLVLLPPEGWDYRCVTPWLRTEEFKRLI